MTIDTSAENAREKLHKKRRALVLAAEKVINDRFARGRLTKPQKTQFSNLIGLCNEATCAEEITNYLRYQAGRDAWERDFTLYVIDGIKPILDELPDDATLHVAAWKLYATYLTRAYVYNIAVSIGGRNERTGR